MLSTMKPLPKAYYYTLSHLFCTVTMNYIVLLTSSLQVRKLGQERLIVLSKVTE